MAALLCNRWFTGLRVLLYGALFAYTFSAGPRSIPNMELIAIAVAATAFGVALGFWLARQPMAARAVSQVGGHYYSIAMGIGFLFAALWATETGVVWPFLVWFLPAGALESFVSSQGLQRRQRAS